MEVLIVDHALAGKTLAHVLAVEIHLARELIQTGGDIRIWQEDESPYQKIAQILKDRGVSLRRIGIDDTARFFVFDGIRKAVPKIYYVSALPVLKAVGATR